jgi:thiol-disulfide isomerase/thioredoxin
MKQPDEPLRFSFADLAGNPVAHTDARFAGKVLIVNVTGSWCPNCHDEAPFLVELYRRYRPLGLEIVAIDFEEAGEPRNRARVEAFIRTYGIEFTYLLGGGTDQVAQMLPQTNNLNAWPTTFFIGRNGKVHGIHAGFAAPASGEFHQQVKREFIATVEKLLSE